MVIGYNLEYNAENNNHKTHNVNKNIILWNNDWKKMWE